MRKKQRWETQLLDEDVCVIVTVLDQPLIRVVRS